MHLRTCVLAHLGTWLLALLQKVLAEVLAHLRKLRTCALAHSCILVNLCKYLHTCAFAHLCTCVLVYLRTCASTRASTCALAHSCILAHLCTCANTCTSTSVLARLRMYLHTYALTQGLAYLRICELVQVLGICALLVCPVNTLT